MIRDFSIWWLLVPGYKSRIFRKAYLDKHYRAFWDSSRKSSMSLVRLNDLKASTVLERAENKREAEEG